MAPFDINPPFPPAKSIPVTDRWRDVFRSTWKCILAPTSNPHRHCRGKKLPTFICHFTLTRRGEITSCSVTHRTCSTVHAAGQCERDSLLECFFSSSSSSFCSVLQPQFTRVRTVSRCSFGGWSLRRSISSPLRCGLPVVTVGDILKYITLPWHLFYLSARCTSFWSVVCRLFHRLTATKSNHKDALGRQCPLKMLHYFPLYLCGATVARPNWEGEWEFNSIFVDRLVAGSVVLVPLCCSLPGDWVREGPDGHTKKGSETTVMCAGCKRRCRGRCSGLD